MSVFPKVVGHYLDEGGRALSVEADPTDGRLHVTIRPATGAEPYSDPRRTERLAAEHRDGVVVVEAGCEGVGPTYQLTIDGDRLLPRVVMGLYDDWDDDLGVPWAFPLSPYHRMVELDAPATVVEQARRAGPIAPGHYRVLVLEPDGRATDCDHDALEAARTHADDAASEDGSPIAYVLDADFCVVARGAHYATRT